MQVCHVLLVLLAGAPGGDAPTAASASLPEMKTVRGKRLTVRVPTSWSLDDKTGRFDVPGGDRRGFAAAVLSEPAQGTQEAFLRDLEPTIEAAQMHRQSLTTKRIDGADRADLVYGRGSSSPTLTMSGVLTTGGPRTILAFCGSTPERKPSGEEVCAPILDSVRVAAEGAKVTEPGRTSGDGWSVVLPPGWKEQARPDSDPGTRMFVAPQTAIAPVFLQIGSRRRPGQGEEDARRFLTSFFGPGQKISVAPVKLGDLPAVRFQGTKAQAVDPAFALLRTLTRGGWRTGVLCIGASAADRALCESVVDSLSMSR